MGIETDLKLLLGNKEMKDITSYLIYMLKDTEDKKDLFSYKYLCSKGLQEELRRGFNDNRHSTNKPKVNEGDRGLSIKDWIRDRGIIVSSRRKS